MEFSDQQRQAVKEWLVAGASLSDVQQRLKSEFGLAMTYMDVRLLVLELGAAVKEKPEPKPPKIEAPKQKPSAPEAADPYADEFDEPGTPQPDDAPQPDDVAGSKVTLSLDRLVVPGAMVSGDVTFSDGAKARWLIDQMGRFGLDPETPGYRPAPADLQAFQEQLRSELKRHGYA